MKRALPIGYDDFKKIITEGLYYVDKTMMIKEILDDGSQVNLFTRPRRFGKTLILSMLRSFFERQYDCSGKVIDNSGLFAHLKIMDAGAAYLAHMGKYPVINLSLKSAKQPSYEMSYQSIVDEIAREYERHAALLDRIGIMDSDRERYDRIMRRRGTAIENAKALQFLSFCLKKAYGRDTIILIDEYDVPLENSYFVGFYKEMIGFIRSLFESALKTNECLKFAVITGCLRISKESIFTGLNNLEINSILSAEYAEHFGFTQKEIDEMLDYYCLQESNQEMRAWYDGYLFGNVEVYNPWSVINFVRSLCTDKMALPKPYWANTSSNSTIRELVERADNAAKQEIERLIEGKTIVKPIHEDITYEDIYKTQDNLWNFLFFTGYLKVMARHLEVDTIYLTLAIPNMEVRYIYRNTIMEWFEQKISTANLSILYEAIKRGDGDAVGREITAQLGETISTFDYAENYYHGFLAGLLKGCPGYIVLSNRESGNGRPDLLLKTPSVRGMAIILEFKVVKKFEDMELGCDRALTQIQEREYTKELYHEGYRTFLVYGVCFYRKECLVKVSKGE